MNQKIYKDKDSLIIEIPLTTERWCPFTNESKGEMDNIIALIIKNKNSTEPDMGFAYQIDMSYKGKDNQWTDFFFKWFGGQKEFEKLCKDLRIGIVYYWASWKISHLLV